MMKKQEFKDYLIENSTVNKETGCWEWNKCVHHSGYGVALHNKIEPRRAAHRLSYSVFVGPVPKGLCVCHDCDNPKCVNPEHLFVGTHLENMQDCSQKGRVYNGNLGGEDSPFYNKKHTRESKDKIGRANAINQKGKRNSQYGTCWIYNLDLKENKKIHRFELKDWVKQGWIAGRKMLF